jgi:hypothetical protein
VLAYAACAPCGLLMVVLEHLQQTTNRGKPLALFIDKNSRRLLLTH